MTDVERVRVYEKDHNPDGFPAVEMALLTRLADRVVELELGIDEALRKDRLKRIDFIRCSFPSDILVVEDVSTANDIAGHVTNPCHNHTIMVRGDYEKSIAVNEQRERMRRLPRL